MSRITTRLRDLASQENHDGEPWDSMQEAADEIVLLQVENHRLREALSVANRRLKRSHYIAAQAGIEKALREVSDESV